jgi:hypothetical protein
MNDFLDDVRKYFDAVDELKKRGYSTANLQGRFYEVYQKEFNGCASGKWVLGIDFIFCRGSVDI